MPLQLSREALTLVEAALRHLEERCDPATGLVTETLEGHPFLSVRNSLYYALALLEAGRLPAAEKSIGAVLDLQLDDPAEVWHGVFRYPEAPVPPKGLFPWRDVVPQARYMADAAWQRISARFTHLAAEAGMDAKKASALLHRALLDTIPVAWETYEPNLREFIGMGLAMALQHFEERLSPALVKRMERSALLLMEGAIARSEANLTPLNTNIRTMYIFLLDFFGARMGREDWQRLALHEARKLRTEYSEFHSVAEFNSPTYCGVDLSTLCFWRVYGAQAEIREIGSTLEAEIWRDMADFYNPAMRNFCGPYSRAYELDMAVHTCMYDLLYLTLGEDRFPFHPFSIESVINPLTVLGFPRMPEELAERFLVPQGERMVSRHFRELSERGNPALPQAVCDATAWITDRLMIGAMTGSRNTSHQLHSLVVFWRCGEGLGTIKLMRSLPDGQLTHLDMALFEGEAAPGQARMTVKNQADQDVDFYFEIQYPGLNSAEITDNTWRLPGLTVSVEADAPAPRVCRVAEDILQVRYPSRVAEPESLEMSFKLCFAE